MASYCTQDHLLVRFGSAELLAIADRNGDSTIDSDVVTAAIAAASAEIDSYIGTRYALPLVATPARVQTVAEDLARYALYTVEPLQIVKDNRAAAIAWLKDVSLGRASLDVPAPAAADTTQSADQIRFTAGDRSASREELRKL